MKQEEQALIKEAQKGNILAFESLVKKYDKHVLQLALNMVNHPQDAEDIYQEVFVRVYKNLSFFQFKSEFSTWLYRVVVNTCINYQKKRFRRKQIFTDQNVSNHDENWKPVTKSMDGSPEQTLLNNELTGEINAAIKKLSGKQKTVFVLRHFHGHKLKEIAKIMKCTEGTVKNYLFRATQKMQKSLAAYSRI